MQKENHGESLPENHNNHLGSGTRLTERYSNGNTKEKINPWANYFAIYANIFLSQNVSRHSKRTLCLNTTFTSFIFNVKISLGENEYKIINIIIPLNQNP